MAKLKVKKVKKTKRALDAAVAVARAVAKGNARAGELAEGQVPDCIKKLSSEQPEEREAALQDLTHLVLQPRHSRVLLAHNAATMAAQLLCADALAPIRSAAAAAIRNMILSCDESDVDSLNLYPNANFDLVGGITAALGAAIDEAAAAESNGPATSNADGAAAGEEGADEGPSADEVHTANVTALYKDIEEFLFLATTLAECNAAAAEAFASWKLNPFLTRLVACLKCNGQIVVQQAAAECLKVIAEDSEGVASYLDGGIDPDTKTFLNQAVSAAPSSPSLLRVSVNLCGALLSVGPTPTNAAAVMPVLVAAVSVSPLQVVQRLVPLLSADSQIDASVRQLGIVQQLDRLRAMQAALQGLTDVLAVVTEEQRDDVDDETAFAGNPAAGVIMGSQLLPAMVERAAEVMLPLQDPVLRSVLLEPTDSGDVATLQRIVASIEVGILSLTSSFMLLLPLPAFGSLQNMWTLIGNAIASRHQRLNEAVRAHRQAAGLDAADDNDKAATASATSLLCLPLQLESLAQMAATVQRKDEAGESRPQLEQLDTFTRLAWNPNATAITRSHVLTIVGKIGSRVKDARCVYSCGNFCLKIVQRALEEALQSGDGSLTPDTADIATEAVDAIMDLFADEDYDDNAYVPLGVDAALRELLPALKRHVQAARGAMKRGSPAWLRKQHLEEVASNASRFLQYKRENCPAIAQQAVGKKYKPTA